MEGSPSIEEIRSQIDAIASRARSDDEFARRLEADPENVLRAEGLHESALAEASNGILESADVSGYRPKQPAPPPCDTGTCIITLCNMWGTFNT